MINKDRPLRTIKSFVRRQGRFSDSQRQAVERLWPLYGINVVERQTEQKLLNFSQLFARQASVVLEIGFGNGHSLAQMALDAPELNFLGIEVHHPGIAALLKQIENQQLTNLRIISDDAIKILEALIPLQSLYRVQLYFPDPWPKTRHHKRRIVQTDFLSLLASRLIDGGVLHMATDWEHYAKHMVKTIQAHPAFQSVSNHSFSHKPDYRPLTKFEQRGIKLGHGIWDLVYRRV